MGNILRIILIFEQEIQMTKPKSKVGPILYFPGTCEYFNILYLSCSQHLTTFSPRNDVTPDSVIDIKHKHLTPEHEQTGYSTYSAEQHK